MTDQIYAGKSVYQFVAGKGMYDDEARRVVVNEFLVANGIDPGRFLVGNPIDVRRHEDGELWVHTWQAVAMGEDGGTLLCEHCPPWCVRQEPVVVRLVTAIPEFADGLCVRAEGDVSGPVVR